MSRADRPKVLVTGGAGYVGSVLVPFLESQGYATRVVDIFFFCDEAEWRASNPDTEVINGDIRDPAVRAAAVAGQDAVIHLAAVSNDPCADLDPRITEEINLSAVVDLVAAARDAGVHRFVNASSSTVYGVKDTDRVPETSSLVPITLYGRLKAESEAHVLATASPDFTAVSLRSATVCGPSPRQRLDLTVNILTHHAVVRGKITVHGGSQTRPQVHIEDLARAYLAVLEADPALVNGRAFNIGVENFSVLEIAELVRDTVGNDASIMIEPVFDARSYRLSTELFTDTLGFTYTKRVRDAICDLADAFAAGRIPEPEDSRYHNIRVMKERDFR